MACIPWYKDRRNNNTQELAMNIEHAIAVLAALSFSLSLPGHPVAQPPQARGARAISAEPVRPQGAASKPSWSVVSHGKATGRRHWTACADR
jgi:hypothetical protein